MDRSPSPDSDVLEAYRRGVTALLEGRLDDASRALAGPVHSGLPEALLAQAKVHLERQEGAPARECLARLLEEPPPESGLHGYLLLLDAVAASLAGAPRDALRRLEEAASRDARMDLAARSLRRRLEKNRPPRIEF
jgi:hypothetical protein